MPQIAPFAGWRCDPGRVDYAKITTPPYDVISSAMQEELYKRDDRNLVRLIFGREFSSDNAYDNRYSRASAHLDAWRSEGLFIPDKPAIYVYQVEFLHNGKPTARRGFFAKVQLSEWGKEGVFPHEKTLAGPKEDRLKLMRSTRANLEPVFGLLADPSGDISRSLYKMCDYETAVDFVDDENTRHKLWVMDSPEAAEFCRGCGREQIFIADGHHRYETAINYRNEVREAMKNAGQTPGELGEISEDWVMMYIVPDSDAGLAILPTHRVFYGLEKVSDLPKRLGENFIVDKCANQKELDEQMLTHPAPAFGYIDSKGQRYFVGLRDLTLMNKRALTALPAWRSLDVSVLHLLILEDLLGIDEGKLLRKENLYYTHKVEEAVRAVKEKRDGAQGAFLLRPTTMEQVRNVSRAGTVMPQKSTYFFPKAVSGLVFNFFW